MSANGSNRFLNIEDANLRVRSGNVYAKGITVGGITVGAAHGLQSVSDVSNTTSNTLQFTNATTSFKATSNIEIGGDVSYTSKPKISVESNVVAEYTGPHDRPLRKYPEVLSPGAGIAPVSVTTPFIGLTQSWNGYEITMSSRWDSSGTYNGDHAFDDNESSIWLSGAVPATYDNNGDATSVDTLDGVNGSYLIMKLPKAIKPSYANIKTRDVNNFAPRHPKTGKFYGSNDGSSWTEIGTFSYGSIPSSVYYQKFNLVGTNTYQYIAIQVHTVFNDSGPSDGTTTSVVILDLQYYGYEEGSGSLDTTLKSVYNVPATTGTQLEVYYDGQETSSYSGSGTTVNDLAGTQQNGTLNGGVGFDPTYKAFTFDGTTTRNITATLPSTVTGEYVHSVSLWVKADEVSRSAGTGMFTFFTIGSASSTNMIALGVNLNSDGIKYDFYDASALVNSPPITSNEWMHFVVTYSGGANNLAGAKRIYLNGKELVISVYGGNSVSSPLSLPTSPTLTLGGQLNSGNPPFSGSIANFRLYSKALNADQVKELYDYQKDYFLGSKSQVTLYKGHLGVGVTEPSGQLELAGDERIQAYPPRGMTHPDGTATGTHTTDVTKNITYIEGHGEFKASASLRSRQDVDYDGHQPYNAFDYTTYSYLLYGPGSGEDVGYNKTTGYYEDNEYQLSASSGTPYGHWLQLEMPYKINVKSYFIQHVANDYWPQDWQIWASNDDINWTHIHTYTGGTFDTNPQYYTVSHTGHYKIYTMIITRIKEGSTLDRVRIQELRYFGTPGPTTLDKGSLSLTRSLDVPRISRYDVDTEAPRPEKLVVDFDTTVNSSPTDISGKGNHGTFYGDAQYSPVDKAFVFDGTDDYIQGNLNNTGDMDFTVSCWFKRTADDGVETVWFIGGTSSDNPGNGTGLDINTLSDTRGYFYFYSGYELADSGLATVIGLNKWVHLVCTRVGNTMKLYLNGEDRNKPVGGSSAHGLSLDANTVFRIGQRNSSGTNPAHGMVSNFKIYSVALEPSEVRKLYNLGRTGRSMVISDTAVGIGKVPEAQLDVRGILKASVGLFQDKPYFGCEVYRYGLKDNDTTQTIYWHGGDTATLSSAGTMAGSRWKLGSVTGNHTYKTNNVQLVSVLNDSSSETSGVKVPYDGYYHLTHQNRTISKNTGTSFVIYSPRHNKYIQTSINGYRVPWGGNTGHDYIGNSVSASLYLEEGDVVIFVLNNATVSQNPASGGFEQFVSLVML
jgi:hypothetical protein